MDCVNQVHFAMIGWCVVHVERCDVVDESVMSTKPVDDGIIVFLCMWVVAEFSRGLKKWAEKCSLSNSFYFVMLRNSWSKVGRSSGRSSG